MTARAWRLTMPLALLALAGCADLGSRIDGWREGGSAADAAGAGASADRSAHGGARRGGPGVPPSAVPQVDGRPVPPPEPGLLLGKTAAEVQGLLGPPDLVRREGAVHVMQYRSAGCVFDVTLYEAGPGAPFKASYLESRDITGAVLAAGACLQSLVPPTRWADWRQQAAATRAVDADPGAP
ncbi:hypothetical protein CCR85_02015 [Rhodothalassium salexigens]|uniref:hypothetical protein n=1 Tax=Rhodothalassium salexigens TaxID=1086 RepID=UPI0019146FEC|nr:hypothetical protein [Rhodothalassium salexigens]MBK5910268.1 hypothetical protein [Rhodothalassium salexigens]MBK5921371.1 hypothetical protein [Rhodothalassium salexigens]